MSVNGISGKDHTLFKLQTCATLAENNLPAGQKNRAKNMTESLTDSVEDYQQIIKKMVMDNMIVQWRNDILTSQPEEQEW